MSSSAASPDKAASPAGFAGRFPLLYAIIIAPSPIILTRAALAVLALLTFAHGDDPAVSPFVRASLELALMAAPVLLGAHVLAGVIAGCGFWRGRDPGRGMQRLGCALRAGFVDAVDRSAAYVLAGLALGALLLTGEVDAAQPVAAGWTRWASLGALLALYALALLRRGGAWLLDLFGGGHAAGH